MRTYCIAHNSLQEVACDHNEPPGSIDQHAQQAETLCGTNISWARRVDPSSQALREKEAEKKRAVEAALAAAAADYERETARQKELAAVAGGKKKKPPAEDSTANGDMPNSGGGGGKKGKKKAAKVRTPVTPEVLHVDPSVCGVKGVKDDVQAAARGSSHTHWKPREGGIATSFGTACATSQLQPLIRLPFVAEAASCYPDAGQSAEFTDAAAAQSGSRGADEPGRRL